MLSIPCQDLAHGIRLPHPCVLGGNEAPVELPGDLPQRQAAYPELTDHADHLLLALVLHQVIVDIVVTERNLPWMLAAVSVARDAKPLECFVCHRMAHIRPGGRSP